MKAKHLRVVSLLTFLLVLCGVSAMRPSEVEDTVPAVEARTQVVTVCNADVSSGFASTMTELVTLSVTAPERLIVAAPAEVAELEPEYIEYETDIMMYVSTSLNVRSEPDAEAEKLGTLSLGRAVHVTCLLDNGWSRIDFDEGTAYVKTEYLYESQPLQLVSSTAYYDKYNRGSASGRRLVSGKSLAGKVSWLGKHVRVYRCNKDGSVGDLMGEYRFDDTGYGAPSGYGESKILKGKTVGTIENGTCIDVYFDTLDECYDYGRRNVYIQFID